MIAMRSAMRIASSKVIGDEERRLGEMTLQAQQALPQVGDDQPDRAPRRAVEKPQGRIGRKRTGEADALPAASPDSCAGSDLAPRQPYRPISRGRGPSAASGPSPSASSERRMPSTSAVGAGSAKCKHHGHLLRRKSTNRSAGPHRCVPLHRTAPPRRASITAYQMQAQKRGIPRPGQSHQDQRPRPAHREIASQTPPRRCDRAQAQRRTAGEAPASRVVLQKSFHSPSIVQCERARRRRASAAGVTGTVAGSRWLGPSYVSVRRRWRPEQPSSVSARQRHKARHQALARCPGTSAV